MKSFNPFKRTSPAPVGNPANPSIEERERMIAKNNKKKSEDVKKIPADELRRAGKD